MRYSVATQFEEDAREDVLAIADDLQDRLTTCVELVGHMQRLHAVLALHGDPGIKAAYQKECDTMPRAS